MKLADYQRDGYKSLNFLGVEVKAVQIDALRYIERLSAVTQTDINDWDFKEVFGSNDGLKVLTDRGVINQKFFHQKEIAPKYVIQSMPVLFNDATRAKISQIRLNQLELRRRDIMAKIKDKTHDIKYHHEELAKREVHLFKMHAEMRTLNETIPDISVEIEAILKKGVWKLWNVSGSELHFVNVNDVVLNYKNLSAGIDLQVNLGRFLVKYGMFDFRLRCFPHFKNVKNHESYHPHVWDSGEICFGNAENMRSLALQRGRISEAFDLLTAVLLHYNPDSPVSSLDRFNNTPIWNGGIEPRCPLDTSKPIEPLNPTEWVDEEYTACSNCERDVDDCECDFNEDDEPDTYTATRQVERELEQDLPF